MMEGEFHSMTELYKLAPTFVPRPLAWGQFRLDDPVTHFFLCEFIDMRKEVPEPFTFCTQLAEIHRNSQSPTGEFGFAVSNCHGQIVQSNDWDPSWTSFFTKLLVGFFRMELETNGRWPLYQEAFQEIVDKVIPQLLEPLQANGRVLEPSLVHGDLWKGNVATNQSSGQPVVFDASAFYAHNEYEIGTWRRKGTGFDRIYLEQYRELMPPSEPSEQWEDRVRLYSLKFKLAHMIGWPKTPLVREEYVS